MLGRLHIDAAKSSIRVYAPSDMIGLGLLAGPSATSVVDGRRINFEPIRVSGLNHCVNSGRFYTEAQRLWKVAR